MVLAKRLSDAIDRLWLNQGNHGVGLGLFLATTALSLYSGSLRSRRSLIAQGTPVRVSSTVAAVPVPSRVDEIRADWIARDGEHDFLKEVLGEKALDWVKVQNTHSTQALGDPSASPLYQKVLSILDSSDKIPFLRKLNDMYYNFWQDKQNPRGLWRRTTMESYLSQTPEWETVLDFDELGKAEGESWVYKGHTIYEPNPSSGERVTRTIMQLSRGGADAVVLREFDLDAKAFVTENGFVVPESKSRVSWKSKDVLLIGTDLKDGKSMTDSGYPRVMREWHRGTSLFADSKVVHEGEITDVSVYMYTAKHCHHSYLIKGRAITFYTSVNSVFLPTSGDENRGEWHELKAPLDAEISLMGDQLLVQLRSAWTVGTVAQQKTYPQGSLLAVGIRDFVARSTEASFTALFEPSATVSLESYTATKDYLVLETLDTVKSRFVFWRFDEAPTSDGRAAVEAKGDCADETGVTGVWVHCGAEPAASIRGSSLTAVDSNHGNEYWFTTSSFLLPTTLQLGDATLGPAGVSQVRTLKSLPAQFDATGLVEQQFQAVSADGTKVPYFLISHRDMPMDGSTPTLLYGYGGFEISLPPVYSGVVGAGWLDTNSVDTATAASAVGSGGQVSVSEAGVDAKKKRYTCYVMANIRGGGEFGPAWHQAALRKNRNIAYDDFIAVAEDLIARKITSSPKLGIRGGSNGGLLMGNMMVRRPDLFGAVCCAVPLLDMRCYHKLLAGASWMAEYGNPDVPEDWAFLQKYSAYHNIDPKTALDNRYPALLMTTSTRDDRVHPYHARSFVKRLLDCQDRFVSASSDVVNKPAGSDFRGQVHYYENIEGGHGGAADSKQQAYMSVMYLEFLKRVLGDSN